MCSIYQDFLAIATEHEGNIPSYMLAQHMQEQGFKKPSQLDHAKQSAEALLIQDPGYKVRSALPAIQLLLNNAKQTADTLLQGRLTALDPIVGENSCEGRGYEAVLAGGDAELLEEAADLKKKVDPLIKRVQGLANKALKLENTHDVGEFLKELKLCVDVSERMAFLLRSHLLTCAKYFYMNKKLEERCGINYEELRKKLSSNKTPLTTVERLVRAAQEQISRQTVTRISSEAGISLAQAEKCLREIVSEEERKRLEAEVKEVKHVLQQLQGSAVREIVCHSSKLSFQVSCSVYRLKTIMRRLCEQQIPILVKEFLTNEEQKQGKTALGLYYRSEKPGALPTLVEGVLDPKSPVFVLEGFFNEKLKERSAIDRAIQEVGVVNLALANVAMLPQYSEDDDFSKLDEEAREEILALRSLGRQLNCHGEEEPVLFRICHVHGASVHEEKVKTHEHA